MHIYVAPEVLLSSESSSGYGLSADIYSLGVLAWELFADSGSDNPLKGLDSSLAWAKVSIFRCMQYMGRMSVCVCVY